MRSGRLSRAARTEGRIRIIGGRWRGRKLAVAGHPELRPTPDRIRETLFNWLLPMIPGAQCLDLFSGTGALGFEALSRGAAGGGMIEQNKRLADLLEGNKSVLAARSAEIIHSDAMAWLKKTQLLFDIVFLDPPFNKNMAQRACELLINGRHLSVPGHVYTETELDFSLTVKGLNTIKQAKAGQIKYMLHEYNAGGHK